MTIDASQLQVSVQERERWRRVLSVTIPAALVRAEEERAAGAIASRARMKGFRKGRVPKHLIEGRYKGALRQEAIDKLVQGAYREALAAEGLQPISEGELEDLQYPPDDDLTFAIAFDVAPQIDVERLGGFVVERPSGDVTDDQIAAVLDRVRQQNGVWRPLEEGAPEDGNLVSVHIVRLAEEEEEGAAEGRDYDFVVGEGDAIPDIEAAIKTLEPGGEGEFDITFPDDFPDESRRGESERIRIKLTARRTLELPELDDDFAKQVGEFETVDDLQAKIREDMEKEASESAENVVRGRLLDQLIEANPFEVPISMVDRYTDGVIGSTEIPPERLEEVRAQVRPEAERAVKRLLMVDRVAETQGLAATEDDIDERVEEIAGKNDAGAAKIYAELQKSGRLEALERELTENKVFNFLKDQSEIIDATAG